MAFQMTYNLLKSNLKTLIEDSFDCEEGNIDRIKCNAGPCLGIYFLDKLGILISF